MKRIRELVTGPNRTYVSVYVKKGGSSTSAPRLAFIMNRVEPVHSKNGRLTVKGEWQITYNSQNAGFPQTGDTIVIKPF